MKSLNSEKNVTSDDDRELHRKSKFHGQPLKISSRRTSTSKGSSSKHRTPTAAALDTVTLKLDEEKLNLNEIEERSPEDEKENEFIKSLLLFKSDASHQLGSFTIESELTQNRSTDQEVKNSEVPKILNIEEKEELKNVKPPFQIPIIQQDGEEIRIPQSPIVETIISLPNPNVKLNFENISLEREANILLNEAGWQELCAENMTKLFSLHINGLD
ncbi:hypothetical protein HK096_003138, partial [Nowakowskiella sp. JEL0078]